MTNGLNINTNGTFDFISLGAIVHRLDPGIVPFRKATECCYPHCKHEDNKQGILQPYCQVVSLHIVP